MQDFGWSLSSHAASADTPGEIGGHVANSRIQAYYAMPLGRPLTFNDRISVSGQFALTELGKRGVSCFGLFNSSRHTWRVFSSMAFRLWEEENYAQVMFDWMSADWRGRGQETAVLIAPDGARHTFQFDYDPDVRPDCTRLDPLLAKHLTSETGNGRPIELQGESFILQRAHSDEPELTAEACTAVWWLRVRRGLLSIFIAMDSIAGGKHLTRKKIMGVSDSNWTRKNHISCGLMKRSDPPPLSSTASACSTSADTGPARLFISPT
ncbi:MAG: hypothetical protein IPI28_00195 [Candidatus Omnitrophica bacterium]|nr:hypothetical protein [Candidatus Omnitrophota bacterium]